VLLKLVNSKLVLHKTHILELIEVYQLAEAEEGTSRITYEYGRNGDAMQEGPNKCHQKLLSSVNKHTDTETPSLIESNFAQEPDNKKKKRKNRKKK
jgi:hypothetical protein